LALVKLETFEQVILGGVKDFDDHLTCSLILFLAESIDAN
jgi:hypothetical protein